MKEKYRVMLQQMLKDMEIREEIERGFKRLADLMMGISTQLEIISEATTATSAYMKDFAEYYGLIWKWEPEPVETQDAVINAYIECAPSYEELFRQIREMACVRDEECEKRHPHEFTPARVPHRIAPHNARYALHSEIIRHRARDMLPN